MRSQASRKNLSWKEMRNLRTLLLASMLEPAEIGERIKLARERAGLRQEDLADLINVSTRTVQYLEAGDVKPYQHLERVAAVTRVTFDWLLHGDPQPGEDADRLAAVEERLARLVRDSEAEREMLAELLRLARGDPEDPQAQRGSE